MGFINSIDPRNIPDAPAMARALRCVITDTFDWEHTIVMPVQPPSGRPRPEFRSDDADFTVCDSDGAYGHVIVGIDHGSAALLDVIELAREMGPKAALEALKGATRRDDDEEDDDDSKEPDEPDPAPTNPSGRRSGSA